VPFPLPPLNFSSTAASGNDQRGNAWGFGDHNVSYGGGVAGVPSWLLIAGLGLGLYLLTKRK
jgi:hypothetical protein